MNGGGGYIVANSDYQLFKSGSLIMRGTYAGCVQVLGVYYWVSPPDSGDYWILNTGAPDATIKKITSTVWSKCEEGGDYNWISKSEWWHDPIGGENYRWAYDGGNVVLVEL